MEDYQIIINSFLSGDVDSIEEKGMVPEHVEAQVSHVFLFSKTVYKICRRDNNFLNSHIINLADKQIRINFFKADYSHNDYFSPDVYLKLFGIKNINGKIKICEDLNDTEDIVMKMRRIDQKCSLSQLLNEKALTENDFETMGYEQTKKIALYPNQPKSEESYYPMFQRKLNDLKSWMLSAPDFFSKKETDKITMVLNNYLEKKKNDFEDFDKKQYVIALDIHSDNIFIENKKVILLDTYPLKEDWMIAAPCLNIYRPAADIFILMGEKYARAFLSGYIKYYGSMDNQHEMFYLIYSAAIQGVSLFNLSKGNEMKKENARLYKKFILDNIDRLLSY